MITPPHSRTARGYTVMEMLVALSICLLITGTSLALNQVARQREEINGVALGLLDWLTVVQRGAQRTTTGCTVTFVSGASMAPGNVLASVSPTSCNPDSSFLVEALNDTTRLSASISSHPTSVMAGFTPRGTTTLVNNMTLTLRHNGRSLTRCVRIHATSGFVAIGSNNNAAACPESSFNGAI